MSAWWAIVRKDLLLFSRDRLFQFLTVLSVLTFIVLYLVMPAGVDETLEIGVHGPGLGVALDALAVEGGAEPGAAFTMFDDPDELRGAVADREIEVGIVFPDGFVEGIISGRRTVVTVLAGPMLPEEYRNAVRAMVREIGFALAGQPLPVAEPAIEDAIVGIDRAGAQVPLRDRMRPLFAFLVLVMESVALSALISAEIQQQTVTAVMAAPVSTSSILAAKATLGTAISFGEATIVMLVIRGLHPAPLTILLALFLGAIMVTGLSMVTGSLGRDLVSTMLISIVFLIPMMVPAMALLFPDTAGWVRFVPTSGLVDTISTLTFDGGTISDVIGPLSRLGVWGALFLIAGLVALDRRVRTL